MESYINTKPVLTAQAYIFTITGSISIVANAIQLSLICRDKNQKKTVFGLALISLNIADLLASILICLEGTTIFMMLFKTIDLESFENFEEPLYAAVTFSLASSFTHVVYIAMQRVIAVAYPFKVRQILTKTRCYVILAILWMISISLAIFVYFDTYSGFIALGYVMLTTGVAMIILYSIVCYKTLKRGILNTSEDVSMRRRRRESERRVLVYSIAITIVYIVCNYPEGLNEFIEYPKFLYIASDFLYSVNPLLDTLLYFMASYCRRRREGGRSQSAQVESAPVRCQEAEANVTTSL